MLPWGANPLLAESSRFDLSNTQTLGVLLWGGLAALTISLLILTRTRWGQAKPLSKCVALSIFAHILLFGYAYATRLILDVPALPKEEIIEFTFAPPDDREQLKNPEPQEAPWDHFATAGGVEPQVALAPAELALDEAAADPAPPVATRPDVLSEAPLAVIADVPKIERPDAEALAPPEPDRMTAPAPLEIAPEGPPSPAAQVADANLAPDVAGPEREETAANATPADDPITRSPTPQAAAVLNIASLLQRSVDDPLNAEDAVATHDVRDDPRHNQIGLAPAGRLASALAAAGAGGGAMFATVESSKASPAPRRIGDGKEFPQLLQSRVDAKRMEQVRRFGGSKETEEAVERALDWLARNQARHGGWIARDFGAGRGESNDGQNRDSAGADADTGITGLALLAFLAHGNTHLEGPYRDKVRRGLEFLLDQQRRSGDLSGRARLYAKMYCHGMAALALSEAWAMSGDASLQPAVKRAVAFTVAAQHPTTGGWRYQPGDLGDTSQFGWQLLALKSAELAGVPTPDATRSGMVRFLRLVSSGRANGLASYRPNGAPSRTMTAEALLCRLMLGEMTRPETVREARDFVLEEPPQAGKMNLYYWYYGSLAMFQVQGEGWDRWNRALQRQVLPKQRLDGAARGSWNPDTAWGGYGGRVYSTAMATLCLEVYYRYLPVLE